MERFLFSYSADCGRSGSLEGLFVATQEEVDNLIGSYAYFGEVLGKHSEVAGNLEANEFEKMDLDSETVEKVTKILGENWSGFDPRNYIRYNCEKCGEMHYLEEFNKEKGICVYCEEEEK